MDWSLQEAKNHLSKLVRLARSEGPQTVTLRGKRVAMVVAAEEYDQLTGSSSSLVEHLLAEPFWDDELVEEINRRNETPSREIDL